MADGGAATMTFKYLQYRILLVLVLIVLISAPLTVNAFPENFDELDFITQQWENRPPQFFNPPIYYSEFYFTGHSFDVPALPALPINDFWQDDMLTVRQLTRRQEGLDLRGYIPVIEPTFGFAHLFLNSHIEDEIVAPFISEARGRARSITFSHDSYVADGVVSVVIFAEIASAIPRTLVRSVNFDTRSGRLLSMDEALDMDISPLVARKLDEMFRSDPANFNPAASINPENQAFYLTNSELVLLFDGFSLFTRDGDVAALAMNRGGIRTYTISADDYILNHTDYNLKLMPLRRIVENLGYTVIWFPMNQRVEIWVDGSLVVELHANDNNYILSGIMQISLEVPPTQMGDFGQMHVPITFFDQVLPLTVYTISHDGSITFLAYQN